MSNSAPDFGNYAEKIQGEYREKFGAFRALLLEFNKKFNLTAVTEEKDIFYKHFLDSLAGEMWIKKGASVAEIGSGAGFPSVPLKIVRDDLKFTLVESVGKKCDFLEILVEKLGLKGVEILRGRAEDFAREEKYREKYDVCLARAVARLNVLAEYCMPFVQRGGIFLSYKGDSEEEVKEAERAVSLFGGAKTETISYELPQGYGKRSLILAKKINRTPSVYPRGNGKERKYPIV